MILPDHEIKKFIEESKIKISPLPDFEKQLSSCSLDLHLDKNFKFFQVPKAASIDVKDKKSLAGLTRLVKVKKDQPIHIHPGEFVLAQTIETIALPKDLMARLEGRSSLGRIGIVVHSTAARFDPGFEGQPTLELGNMGRLPVALYYGMRICSFTFEKLSSPCKTPYKRRKGAKYVGKSAFSDSKIGKDE